jgi:hypothetical protein
MQRDATGKDKEFAGGKRSAESGGMTAGSDSSGTLAVEKVRKGKGGKIGRPLKIVSEADRKKALEACKLGIPLERVAILCGFPSGNAGGWAAFIQRNPAFADELEKARLEGELELSSVVRNCGPGWQGSAWLLERTRGYVARAQLEHTGTGGKELSISGSLLGAFGGK